MWFGDPTFDTNFWPGFFGNLFADIIVAIVLVSLLARLGQLFKSGKADINMEIIPRAGGVTDLSFSVANTGKLPIGARELVWHIFLDPSLPINTQKIHYNINVPGQTTRPLAIFMEDEKAYTHFQGYIDGPVFPGTSNEIFHIQVAVRPFNRYYVRYFLLTNYGRFPTEPWLGKLRRWRTELWLRLRGKQVPRVSYAGIKIIRTEGFVNEEPQS